MKRAILALCCLAAVSPAGAAGKPNLLVILADDMGWSDLGCQGSEIATPNLDRLAAEGVSFRQFYNAARCCPTRAALLTGLYPHQAGIGEMVVDRPGAEKGPYQGYLNDTCTTLAEALKPAGYRGYLAGKWHVGEFRPQWPVDRGFDHAYGLISGAMNYYDIRKCKSPGLKRVFARDGERIVPAADGFYATEAFTAAAAGFLEGHRKEHAGKPWFLYLAYTAPHWPLHAPEEIVRKYVDRYRAGWQPVREARHRKQLELGVIPAGTPLSPPNGAEWNKLTEAKRAEMTRKMAVYAAMTEIMDAEIGRLRALLEKAGELENTVVVFLSDNGACAEGGPTGANMRPDLKGLIGTVDSYHNYGQSWSNVSNTPFRRHKADTHEGGIRTPCIVRWPAGLKARPGSRPAAVGHVIDLMPTLCEIAGAKPPEGLPGRSLMPVLQGIEAGPRTLGWEHFGAAAWREGDWKLVREGPKAGWELYDLAKDPCELADLAAVEKEKAAAMAAAWGRWAKEVGVK
jgi:arylsulfatase